MDQKTFDKKGVIMFGWNTWKANIVFFVVVLITSWIVTVIPDIGGQLGLGKGLTSGLLELIAWVLSIVVGIGTTKIALVFAEGKKPDFLELFKNYRLFFKYVVGWFLYGVIVLAGLVLLIVPGIIWAIKFHFYSYLIVDKGLGPIEALKRSAQLTAGVKKELFYLGLLLVGINILGVLALLVGIFASIPVTMLASAYVYRKLLAQTDSSDATLVQADDPNVDPPSTILAETKLTTTNLQ